MTAPTPATLDWFGLAMGLLGGLALFLFGLDQLSDGLKQSAGDTLKKLLTRLTSNRFLGALTGAVVTGILNSSSVTTVLVVGFVTAGVMSLAQSVAVIMGANIGSTVTAQLLAFNLSAYALLPVAVGFFMLFASKRERLRQWGAMIMGLGLVFYGMGIMSEAMKPLRTHPPFVQALATMEKPLYGILAGAVFTGLVQSSAATVGIAIALASEGLLTLPAGISLALGANIGTCATALLAALGKPVEAVRAAAVHVVFNVLGVLLWLPFIGGLARLATAVSPASPALEGAARLAAEVPRQIANANTLFNVLNTAVFIGFTGWFARLSTRLIPGRKVEPAVVSPQFLDPAALPVPAVALEQVRQELGHLGQIVRSMLVEVPPAAGTPNTNTLASILKHGQQVQALESAVLEFLGRIRERTLPQAESQAQIALMIVTVHFRTIADVIADDLVGVLQAAASRPGHSATLAQAALSDLYQAVQRAVELTAEAIRQQDAIAAEAVTGMSGRVRQLAEGLMERLASGLEAGDPQSLVTLRLQTTFVDGLLQIFTLAKRIARNARAPQTFGLLLMVLICAGSLNVAQATTATNALTVTNSTASTIDSPPENPWSFSVSAYTYIVPDSREYVQPTITTDRGWLHLEARYNYEGLDTGSAWIGYNVSVGDKLTFKFTPMLGGVFGDTTGIAPGYHATLSWWKLELYTEGEFLFDTRGSSDSFFYTWSELSLAPTDWFRVGGVVQRTKLYQTDFDIQRGFLVGFSYKPVSLTTYVFNPDEKPTFVIAVGVSF